jgi:serine/threonine protein kinase
MGSISGRRFAHNRRQPLATICITCESAARPLEPEWMARQIRAEKLDARTDLFSFGMVLYEMATGRKAFSGDTAPQLREAILNSTPIRARELNPKLPNELEAIINRALEKDREARYKSAAIVRADLEMMKREIAPKNRFRCPSLSIAR